MGNPMHCYIRIKGYLSEQWQDWLSGVHIQALPEGETLLSGVLSDQPALLGVMRRVGDLGLEILAIHCSQVDVVG